MSVGFLVVEETALVQVGANFRVGVLNEFAGEGVPTGDDPLQVHRLDK